MTAVCHYESVVTVCDVLRFKSINARRMGTGRLAITVEVWSSNHALTDIVVYMRQDTHYFYLTEACDGDGYWSFEDAVVILAKRR